IAGPAPQNPPVIGARVPLAALLSWAAPPSQPQPAGVPTPLPVQNPPLGVAAPVAVTIAWATAGYDVAPPRRLTPPLSGPASQNPPVIGARVQVAALLT